MVYIYVCVCLHVYIYTCCIINQQVINRNGEKLGPGEVGEMLARGPQIMKGYLGNTEASAVAVDKEGWLHTGHYILYNNLRLFMIMLL